MAVNEIYRFHSLRFNSVTTGPGATTNSTVLGGVTAGSINPNAEVTQEFVDGSPIPSQTFIKSFAEEAQFTTTNIDAALDIVGTSGSCLAYPGGVEIFFARYAGCNTGPEPGAVHRKVTITSPSPTKRGLIYGTSLNCDHRGDATYSFSIAPQSNGINSAMSFQNNVALPTGAIDNTNRYSLGPITIGGVLVNGVKSVNTEFGVTVERESADSAVFDEYFTISQLATKISISGINSSWWDTNRLGPIGKAASHADTSIIFRRRRSDGQAGFEPDVDSKHVRLTAAGIAVPTGYFDSSGVSPVASSFDLYTHSDGTNVPLIANTDVSYQ